MHRKCTENHPNGGPTGAAEGSDRPPTGPRTPTMAQDSSKEPLQASSGPSGREVRPPRRAQESLRRPQMRPKTAPKGPKMRSKRPPEGWTERVRTKM